VTQLVEHLCSNPSTMHTKKNFLVSPPFSHTSKLKYAEEGRERKSKKGSRCEGEPCMAILNSRRQRTCNIAPHSLGECMVNTGFQFCWPLYFTSSKCLFCISPSNATSRCKELQGSLRVTSGVCSTAQENEAAELMGTKNAPRIFSMVLLAFLPLQGCCLL
jgi:hypothetical protein